MRRCPLVDAELEPYPSTEVGPRRLYHRGVRRMLDDLVDLVSIGLPGLAVVAVPASALAVAGGSSWWWAAAGVVVVVIVAGACWWPRRRMSGAIAVPGAGGDHGVTLLAANVYVGNRSPEVAARELVDAGADIVVVSELSQVVDEALAAAYPHREVISVGGPRGHGVFSRFPLERLPEPSIPGPLLHLRVFGPFGFELLAAHLPRPTVVAGPRPGVARLAECRETVAQLAMLASSRPDVVVAGDLNLSDRQPAYRRMVAGRLDAMRTVRARSTFHGRGYWWLFAMRIDHLVVPAGWTVSDASVVRVSGSDHRAVRATLWPPCDDVQSGGAISVPSLRWVVHRPLGWRRARAPLV